MKKLSLKDLLDGSEFRKGDGSLTDEAFAAYIAIQAAHSHGFVPDDELADTPVPAAYLAQIGRKGGKAGRGRSKARSPEQARAAARARWAKAKLKQ